MEVLYGQPTGGDCYRLKKEFQKVTKVIAILPPPSGSPRNVIVVNNIISPMSIHDEKKTRINNTLIWKEFVAGSPNDRLVLDFRSSSKALKGTVTRNSITGIKFVQQFIY